MIVLLVSLLGCPGPDLPPKSDCEPEQTRCHEGAPQVCSPSRRWTNASDPCSVDGAACCVVMDGYGDPIHACSPEADCAFPGDGGPLP